MFRFYADDLYARAMELERQLLAVRLAVEAAEAV